jgi:hypothetical protein
VEFDWQCGRFWGGFDWAGGVVVYSEVRCIPIEDMVSMWRVGEEIVATYRAL